jgi:hypothetical protein
VNLKTDSHPNEKTASPAGAMDEMLTKAELAAKLKVIERTIENWQAAGYLPYLKISNVVLFYWPDVVEHLRANFKVCGRGVFTPRPPTVGSIADRQSPIPNMNNWSSDTQSTHKKR